MQNEELNPKTVIPAQAGIHNRLNLQQWIPDNYLGNDGALHGFPTKALGNDILKALGNDILKALGNDILKALGNDILVILQEPH